MQSYRQRIAVQMQHKPKKSGREAIQKATKTSYLETRDFLVKAIMIHKTVSSRLEPLSDEWTVCNDILFKYKTDLEILEKGTYDERKGVIKKYGR